MTDNLELRKIDEQISLIIYGPFPADRCRICGWILGGAAVTVCTPESCSLRPPTSRRADEPRHYSTDDGIALAALDEFCKKREWYFVVESSCHLKISGYFCYIRRQYNGVEVSERSAETIALAICAAIAAAGKGTR